MDINIIAENLTELLQNTVNMTSVYYDLFLNPEPMDVDLTMWSEDGVLETVAVPNRAKMMQFASSGQGAPEGFVEANIGAIYIDELSLIPYIKVVGSGSTGWEPFETLEGVVSYLQANNYTTQNDVEEIISRSVGTRVTTISKNSTDSEFPTAKCVYNVTSGLKAYEDVGELLTDPKGLADVTKYAHSTFDNNKFTAEGSPIVTNDGIASGFSVDDYLTSSVSIPANSNYTIRGTFTTGTLTTSEYVFSLASGTTNQLSLMSNYYNDSHNLSIVYPYDTWIHGSSLNLSNDTTYSFEVIVNGANLRLLVNGVQVVNLNTYTNGAIDTLYIGRAATDIYPWSGSIDLKPFSIAVDGVSIFTSNKVGVDTIKPDDYTVVGSPTISDKGVASGFSDSNYLKINNLESYVGNSTNWSMIFCITTDSSFSHTQTIFDESGYWGNNLRIKDNGTMALCLTSNGSSYDIANYKTGTIALQENTTYFIRLSFNGSKYLVEYSTDNDNYSTYLEQTSSSLVKSINSYMTFGAYVNSGTFSFEGTIDLNVFKIYVDGDLVYQPCLKIPYTLSKSGSKVVDSNYRDRVSDMYKQFGYSPYYTLEEGLNFTLPQGELYGLIGQQALRKASINGINRTFLYSNRTQILTGSCTSGTEVVLSTPFVDSNYMLSVPYSAKSATAFTPTQTGDWFAIGEGILEE